MQSHLLTCNPNSHAFFATNAAPSITLGFEVFVQLVIAAITTSPCLRCAGVPWNVNAATLFWDSFGTVKSYNNAILYSLNHKNNQGCNMAQATKY